MRKEKKHHFIYKTTNLLSGKYYIGMHSTDNLNDGYLGSGRRLRYSLNKYGKENHKLEILEFCSSRKELKSREAEVVNLDEIAKEECLNLYVGGGGTLHSESTRKKMRENAGNPWLGKKRGISFSKKMSEVRTGMKFTEEHKNNIRLAKLNTSQETRDKIRKSLLGNQNGKGYKHTDETKKKMSETRKNRPAHNKGIPQKKVKCPYCEKEGGAGAMKLHHFDNCKFKK